MKFFQMFKVAFKKNGKSTRLTTANKANTDTTSKCQSQSSTKTYPRSILKNPGPSRSYPDYLLLLARISNAIYESTPSHSFPGFLLLPAEIRNIIYEQALASKNPIRIVPDLRILLPSLLQVNRQIRQEASTIFYRSNVFAAAPGPEPWDWLSNFCPMEAFLRRTGARWYRKHLVVHIEVSTLYTPDPLWNILSTPCLFSQTQYTTFILAFARTRNVGLSRRADLASFTVRLTNHLF